MEKQRKLGVFDIDGTVFRSSLVISMFDELVRTGLFPQQAQNEIGDSFNAWLNRKGHYDDYIWKVVELYVKYTKGLSKEDIDRAAKSVILEEKDRVYRFTRDLIISLKQDNYFLLAISASPENVVSEFAKSFGFDTSFGTPFEIENGVHTGEAKSIHAEKEKILEDFFVKHKGLLTLKNSIGVGDTESDIPLLSFVENPIAFNPDSKLLKHAKEKGWRVVVERKDVIYDVKDFKTLT